MNDLHFQPKWLPWGSVIQFEEPLSPGCRVQFLPPREKGRERRLYMKRARRLRDRADREGWTASELYTAINNGCHIGRVTEKGVPFPDIPECAWRYFIDHYFSASKPPLTISYEYTRRAAIERGWGELPSIGTFRRHLKRVAEAA